MREEFLEPMPSVQTNATLVFGSKQVACFIVDVTVDEFCVAVPNAEHYEGDPKLLLVTHDAVYPVRILLQVPHAGGYSYRLFRIREVSQSNSDLFQRVCSKFSTSRCCILAVIAVIMASVFCVPVTNEQFPLLSLRGIRKEAFGWWSPSITENEQVPPGISLDQSLAVDDESSDAIAPSKQTEFSGGLHNVSVSRISAASLSTSSVDRPLPDERTGQQRRQSAYGQTGKTPVSPRTRAPSLVSLLNEGQVGRIQTASPSLVPWLFDSTRPNLFGLLRLSDAAWSDLQQFEAALSELAKESRSEAIASLRMTLKQAFRINNANVVRGAQDILVLTSDDANVYFRAVNGTVELVRVLPIDFHGAESQ